MRRRGLRVTGGVAVGLLACLASLPLTAQLLPPPRDGDVRVVYWELQDKTEVWLTLEPQSADGASLPVTLALDVEFPGRRPTVPLTEIVLRAWANLLYAPRPELSLVIDDREVIDLAAPTPNIIYANTGPEDGSPAMAGVAGALSIAKWRQVVAARSIGGNALRLPFTLTAAQRAAIGAFLDRVQSDDPGHFRSR